MNRLVATLTTTLLAALVLSACGLTPGVGGPQATGDLVDPDAPGWPDTVLLALVGVSSSGEFEYSNQQQIVDEDVLDGYVLELPNEAAQGAYEIVAYDDTAVLNNNQIDDGERVGGSDPKFLIYVTADTTMTFMGQSWTLLEGWNGVDTSRAPGTNNPFQGDTYGDFDLTLDAP